MKKKTIIIAVVVAAVALGGTGMVIATSGKPSATPVRTDYVSRGELAQLVSTTGSVNSVESIEVYSNLTYPVLEVNVAVGDPVNEGDVLAQLNTADLESDIAQKRAAVGSQYAVAQQQLESAQKALETYDYNASNDYDSTLLAAEAAVEQAELALQTANVNLRAKRNERNLMEEEGMTDVEERALKDSILALQIEQERAHATLENAEKDLEAAKVKTSDSKVEYKDAVKSAQLGLNMNDQWIYLSKLEADLADATIKAPASGIVTAVKAKEGASGSGLLFVIQDPKNLKVVTNIKEYDIQSVKPGNPVEIRTDGTGDSIFHGELKRIAPTSTKSSTGEAVDSTDVEFESEVLVTEAGELRIGMNARLDIITQKKSDVLYIPFDAIVDDMETGQPCVFVMRSDGADGFIAQKVPVTIGMETDFYAQISSDEIKEGDVVILESVDITDGMTVMPEQGSPQPEMSESQSIEASEAAQSESGSSGTAA